jgi:predicted phosphodiesterase
VEKNLPVVTNVPDKTNVDQYGAYIYYALLKDISKRMTPKEALDEKIFNMRISGFNDSYTYLDFYPAQQKDGTISAPVLFKNIQRTWDERQKINNVKVKNTFIEAVSGAINWNYYFTQAKVQYLENPNEKVEIVVFGHTHVPTCKQTESGSYYINSGTWIDHNVDYPDAPRTFVVITTGEKDTVTLNSFMEDGTIKDISNIVNK